MYGPEYNGEEFCNYDVGLFESHIQIRELQVGYYESHFSAADGESMSA